MNHLLHEEEDLHFTLEPQEITVTVRPSAVSTEKDPGAKDRITRLIQLASESGDSNEKMTYLRCARALEEQGHHTGMIFYNVVDRAALEVQEMYARKAEKRVKETQVIEIPTELLVEDFDGVGTLNPIVEAELVIPPDDVEPIVEIQAELIEDSSLEYTIPGEIDLSPELIQLMKTSEECAEPVVPLEEEKCDIVEEKRPPILTIIIISLIVGAGVAVFGMKYGRLLF